MFVSLATGAWGVVVLDQHSVLLCSVGGANRPRSKTFEEYEKETSDLWDDTEEDMDSLTHSAELDMVPEGVAGRVVGGRRRANSRGKGKTVSGELKTFFTDVVKAKASPKLRPHFSADRKLKVNSLTEQAMRHLGEVEGGRGREGGGGEGGGRKLLRGLGGLRLGLGGDHIIAVCLHH